MPKLKTKKALAKRIKITKKKKALRSKAGRRHLLSGKGRKRKRNLRKKDKMPKELSKLVKRALPYSA
ncbi:MAG: 50S ribosomal protein L35 [Candidatus Omnitrophica bacterium]|jgi:large subunit ribosomal protein L35|nr:50S ribosomal protein L35 [Candidatus Omnitrophota bacterium]MCF7891924.1 50S ribosomal protein L35 [Candidatus Omnitrophota bacterium]MCF7896050.1 50S ribosomal protein L35 [Candidatus Omnitrophota bacterium]MCF7897457.1 50S ribosomal protein L35 [Candidatus Omnitrophota bacterium]MCF7909365.1 50S ribosomal protein L35 [Candidatus Omnitrophota bacterium]